MIVSELIEVLRQFPPEMDVVGSDGRGLDRPISVYRCDNASEVAEDPRNGPLYEKVVIDVDW